MCFVQKMATNDSSTNGSGNSRRNSSQNRKNNNGQKGNPASHSRDESALGNLRRNFLACTRCSHFLSGFQAISGLDRLVELAGADSDWLELVWDSQMRVLLHKSFGGRVDLDAIYYSGTCPECKRLYEVEVDEEGDDSLVRVQVNPRLRR
jgi:hypothetical protein